MKTEGNESKANVKNKKLSNKCWAKTQNNIGWCVSLEKIS